MSDSMGQQRRIQDSKIHHYHQSILLFSKSCLSRVMRCRINEHGPSSPVEGGGALTKNSCSCISGGSYGRTSGSTSGSTSSSRPQNQLVII